MSAPGCDVLVIGAGLAGGIAALRAAELGRRVILLSSGETASSMAQGGIVFKGARDPSELVQDILAAGARKNHVPAVNLLAEEGPAAVDRWLVKKLGVAFDTNEAGAYDLALEAVHQSRRILHVKDYTGAAIMQKLEAALAQQPLVTRLRGTLVDLLLSHLNDERYEARFGEARVTGAYVMDEGSSEVHAITAPAVILASGGFSQLFQHSTGPRGSRGDGISAAHRAGARTLDLEYVQFHPTALYMPGEPRWLLTEALRGAGARLLNPAGKPFVDELAPRDVVSRSIHEELMNGGEDHVWLDLKNIAEREQRFPNVMRLLREKGFDPAREWIPVVPAAHYTIGGVWTDLRGATSLPGLFAAGEVACTGLHGANRLASTSLLEAVVFGERAADAACEAAQGSLDFKPKAWRAEVSSLDPALLSQDWQLLRQTMWNYVGLVRSERRLRRAERILVELRTEVESFYKKSALNAELVSLRHAVLVANLVLYAALRNRESVGTHYLKEDY